MGEDKGQGGPIYASKPVPPPPPAPRHQYYQLQNKVTVDVYAKNIAKEAVSCDFSETHVTFTIRDAAGEEEYKLDVELYGKVWKRVGVKGEGERGGGATASTAGGGPNFGLHDILPPPLLLFRVGEPYRLPLSCLPPSLPAISSLAPFCCFLSSCADHPGLLKGRGAEDQD